MSLYDRSQRRTNEHYEYHNSYDRSSIIKYRFKKSIVNIIATIVMQILAIWVMYTFRFDTILLVILFICSICNIINIIDEIYYIRTGDRIMQCKLDN